MRYLFVSLMVILILLLKSPLYLNASIKSHKDSIKTLNNLADTTSSKVSEFRELIVEIANRVEEIKKIFKETKKKIPLNKKKKGKTLFTYYEDNVVTYKDSQGLSIGIGEDEKLIIKNKGFSYTLRGKHYYSEFVLVDKKSKKTTKLKWLAVNNYEYWENDNSQYGFKSKDDNRKVLYKLYTVVKDDNAFYKITLGNKSGLYFSKASRNRTRYYTFFSDKTIKADANGSISYYMSNKQKIGYHIDKNDKVKLSGNFIRVIYSKDIGYKYKKPYIKSFIEDFPNHRYARYLKRIIDNKVPLANSRRVTKFLIDSERKLYKLDALKENKKLNAISAKHVYYLIRNRTKNFHEQEEGKMGFYGKTPFERRKKIKYPNEVQELVVRGNDYIDNFIFSLSRKEWIGVILSPNGVDFGFSSKQPSKTTQKLHVLIVGLKQTKTGQEGKAEEEEEKENPIVKEYIEANEKAKPTLKVREELLETFFGKQ